MCVVVSGSGEKPDWPPTLERRNMNYYEDNYRYSQEAQEADLRIVWECNQCWNRREDYPGINEGGDCHCGGEYKERGESYLA